MALPPWLNISPSDYLRAVEAGTQAGLSIRQANQRAWEAAQRLSLEAEAQQERYAALAEESAQRRMAQEGLDRYRQGELANAQARIGVQGAGEQSLADYRQAEAQRALSGLDEIKRHNLETEAAAQAAAQARAQGKDYGAPTFVDVPGVPGAKVAYRPGSPGSHMILPQRQTGELTPTQAATLLGKIGTLADIDPSITNEVPRLRNIAFPKPQAPKGKSKRFRYNPQTGKLDPITDTGLLQVAPPPVDQPVMQDDEE